MASIMVVDDSAMTRRLISSVVSRDGHSVDSAENGVEALEKLFRDPHELVIIDMNMPQMDGVELILHLRRDDLYRKTPIIVLSSESEPGDIDKALRAGANIYLTKPTDSNKLLQCIRTLLKVA